MKLKIIILIVFIFGFLNQNVFSDYNNHEINTKHFIAESDNKLINKFIDKLLYFSNKKNINLEVLIKKIEINISKKNLSKRVDFIINEIIKGLKMKVCNSYYKVHKNINASVFWVGEESNSSNAFISNKSSAWDEEWLERSIKENKYYFALPYNDFDDNGNRKNNVVNIPWYHLKKWSYNESILKNRWIKITKNNKIAFAQWEDVGPLGEDDINYVFGNKKSKNTFGLKAGIDLSPKLADYLNIDGEGIVNWSFVPEYCVNNNVFKKDITISNINWK